MDSFYSPWNVKINSKHGSSPLHSLFVCNVVVWDWNTELKYSQLNITSSSDVAVHVDFVVKSLLMLNHETLKGSVLITL